MRRRWLATIAGLSLLAAGGLLYALPEVVRQVAIVRIHAITQRPVRIDAVTLNILTGSLTVRGFHLAERGEAADFADFDRLDARVRLLPLLHGHLWIRELVLRNPTVRVVRFPSGFNLTDLVQSSGGTSGPLDVTVDRFVLAGGTVSLEDRALPEWRTWTSENIQIEARNVSTRRNDGSAVGTSVTAGALTSIEIERLRLYPIHLQATMTVRGLDLALARLYLPPDATLVLDRGRASTSVRMTLDARGGLRATATAQLKDVALVRAGEREPLVRVPALTAQLTDFAFQDEQLQLGRFEVIGSASVLDPSATGPARFKLSTVRVSLADLTWPVTRPGRLDVQTGVPGGGTLRIIGMVRPPPAPSQLQLQLAKLDLAPWAQFLPVSARIHGVAEADLHINEPLRAGVPTRVLGSMAVNGLGVRDVRQEVLGVRRVEATGLEVRWPTRLSVKRLSVNGLRGRIERDKAGGFPALGLVSRVGSSPGASTANAGRAPVSTVPTPSLEFGEIVVGDGAMAWRDEAVSPAVVVDFSRIDARITGVGWPLRGPLGVRVAAGTPGGGELQLAGRVGIDPVAADVRLTVKDADLAPYQSYAPTGARIAARADLDLAVALPVSAEGPVTVRGDAVLSRVDVRDGLRTVMRVERAAATGLDIEWPRRVTVREVALERPWFLLEGAEAGALPLRTLLPSHSAGAGTATRTADPAGRVPAVAVSQILIDDGGVRLVDRRISPPFALDLQRVALRLEGLATVPAKPARVELTGRAGPGAEFELRGSVGAIGGPLSLDLDADLRGFAVPRTNPYLLAYVGWEAPEGWLATGLRCRIEGDALDARTDIRLSRLELAPGTHDEAKTHIGLPLGLIVGLMKDSHGDIRVSLPVNGRLSDPHFDLTETIWSTVRNVAINAIMAPVSWIGRIQLTSDSRIERIQIDPISFQSGTATLTPDGQKQVGRVLAFLRQASEVRLALTPVVSPRDLAELRRHALDVAIGDAASKAGTSLEAVATRLFAERFPGRALPGTAAEIRAALVQSEPVPPAAVTALATQRVETVRAMVKQAGIDPVRLLPKDSAVEGQGEVEGQVALDLAEPESPRRPPPQRREFLGAPLGWPFPTRQ